MRPSGRLDHCSFDKLLHVKQELPNMVQVRNDVPAEMPSSLPVYRDRIMV